MSNKEKADLFIGYFSCPKTYKKSRQLIDSEIKKRYLKNSKHEYDGEEIFHSCLIKSYDRIIKKGFDFGDMSLSACSIMSWMLTSMGNNYLQHCKSQDRLVRLKDYDQDEDNEYEKSKVGEMIEDIFSYNQEEHIEEQEKHIEVEKLVWDIFEFVDQNYDGVRGGLYKFYFKTMLSFSQLEELTKYSRAFIYNSVTSIKKDVIKKFRDKI